MAARLAGLVTLVILGVLAPRSLAQDKKAPEKKSVETEIPAPAPVAPPGPNVVAATVNGQVVRELDVYRALSKVAPKNQEFARKEILNYLIDNLLIEQYLTQLKVAVTAKEIDEKLEQIRTEANKKDPAGFDKLLKSLLLTEAELRKEMASALRWDHFVTQQSTEKTLKEMFDRNTNMFDGTQMKARHILLKDDKLSAKEMIGKLNDIKKQIEQQTDAEMAKVAADAKDKTRSVKLAEVFAKFAADNSTCPSKENGGDLGWFPRAGAMVEPFARAAFALKPFQMSEPVATEFGYHLILATDLKQGKEVKYDEVKPFVQEIYAERLREAVIAAMRPNSKIALAAPTK